MDAQRMGEMAVEKQVLAIVYGAPSTNIEVHFQPCPSSSQIDLFPNRPNGSPLKKLPTVQDQIHLFSACRREELLPL